MNMRTCLTLALIVSISAPISAFVVNSKSSGGSSMNERLVGANNQFGFDLFNQLQSTDKDKNIFFSPLSIATALEMTYNGAAGETKEAMARTLKLEGMKEIEVNQASANLMKSLKSADPKIELAIANSLWAKQGVKFKEEFLDINRQYFGAEIASLNFADPKAKTTINNWVSKNTKGKIPAIIDQINSDQALFLINAIYFKGLWEKKFDKALTKNEPFYLVSGAPKQAPMMSQSGTYLYYRGDKFQAVSLPYGKGSTSLYLFLPDKGSSLSQLMKEFPKCEQWIKSFRKTPGDVKIPRFKMEYEKSLNETIKALGMGVAFTREKADFSRMRSERDLFISEVKHKAIVDVNEEGTEAAAGTSVGISVTSAMPVQERFSFIADHPFLMAIRDEKTGAILFMGVVVEPI
jgi:serine protease inhibitor